VDPVPGSTPGTQSVKETVTTLSGSASQDPGVQWAQHYQYIADMMDRAAQTFYLSVDKDLAAKAAYKALGLDPRDSPTFGWGLMQAKQAMADQTATLKAETASVPVPAAPAPPPPSVAPAPTAPAPTAPATATPANLTPWWKTALVATAGAGAVLLPLLGYGAAKLANPSPPTPAAPAVQSAPAATTAAAPQGWQMQFESKGADGSWHAVGGPVPIGPATTGGK
jgi:hypothetical protein